MTTGALPGVVQEYLAHLAVERGLSANTLGAYRRDLGRYVAYLAARGRTSPAARAIRGRRAIEWRP